MENSKKISLQQIKEAIKQADANIQFEEVRINYQRNGTTQKTKTLKRGNTYDKRSLG